jgi:hypothetical protein
LIWIVDDEGMADGQKACEQSEEDKSQGCGQAEQKHSAGYRPFSVHSLV